MISADMSWTHELEEFVPSGSLKKGRDYFQSRSVVIQQVSANRVEAIVRAGGQYSVVIETHDEEETVVASCTCKFYDDIKICKHIWATLLEAESKGHLKHVAKMTEPFIETELEYAGISEDDDDEFGEPDDEDDSNRYHYRPNPKPPKAPPVERWKEQLKNLRMSVPAAQAAPEMEAPRRVIYMADAARSVEAGALFVEVGVCRRKKDGEWGKPSKNQFIRSISQLDAEDQKLLALLSGSRDTYSYPYGNFDEARPVHRLLPAAQDLQVSMLCQTGRFFLKPANPAEPPLPMRWDDGPPCLFKIEVRALGGHEYVVKGLLLSDNQRIALTDAVLLVPGLAFFRDRVIRFEDRRAFRWVQMLRNAGELTVPANQITDFMKEIGQFSSLPPLELPEELRIETRALCKPAELTIRPLQNSWSTPQILGATVTFNYDGVKVAQTHGPAMVHDPRLNRYFNRDRDSETAVLNRLPELGFRPTGSWQQHRWEIAPSRLPAAVRALVAEGWMVDAEGKIYRRAGSFQMNVASGVDWFELHGKADFEGVPIEMPQLLKAIARGEHTVRLGDGTYGLLPEEWVNRYRMVAALGKSSEGQLRFDRHQAGLLDALLAEQPEVTFDEGFTRVRQEIGAFRGVRAAQTSEGFHGQLRQYQCEGLGWLQFLRRFRFGGCLADDMGLGKTVQVLALLEAVERSRPSLIVAPRSLIFNWKQEAARFTPKLRILDHTGVERMSSWDRIESHDVILTTYGTLRRDAPKLKDIHFDTVVLDEAQVIKNATTESAKAARLLKANHRLALTGTPVENRLGDLWSLFEFLNPGLLGSASVFRTHLSVKGAGKPSEDPDSDSLRIISKALRPFLLRRTKEQVARELPAKMEQTIFCELEPEQRKLYDELRSHYRNALLGRIDDVGMDKSRMQILEALLRLRQAAIHPGLIDKTRASDSSAKLDALLPQISELIEEGHKALVFSQFTSFLDILRQRLEKDGITYEYLDGRTRDRQARVERFQHDDSCRLFLISLKAGGLGLNLTAAEYVFLLDPWWNPAIEAQAIDRTHRIGQTRNVFAYRLIARDTVEEKILELQRTKRELADAIVTADNSVLASLCRENLDLLLS
jgi:superfamily II DNA or RNA helicase